MRRDLTLPRKQKYIKRCLNNVAKGIARDELPYAMEMYNCVVRNDLKDMIYWYIGIACELFRSIAPAVADYLGCTYNWQDDENMATYLKRVKTNDYAVK